jgi:hypothetical protein
MKEILPEIINRLENEKVKYEVHSFPSGAIMVDIFTDDKFYVIQIDKDEIGLSLNTEETGLFDIIPDKSFKRSDEFKIEFEKIFK